jgi:hypothetical protein
MLAMRGAVAGAIVIRALVGVGSGSRVVGPAVGAIVGARVVPGAIPLAVLLMGVVLPVLAVPVIALQFARHTCNK